MQIRLTKSMCCAECRSAPPRRTEQDARLLIRWSTVTSSPDNVPGCTELSTNLLTSGATCLGSLCWFLAKGGSLIFKCRTGCQFGNSGSTGDWRTSGEGVLDLAEHSGSWVPRRAAGLKTGLAVRVAQGRVRENANCGRFTHCALCVVEL